MAWDELPQLIFIEIMTMVGLESLTRLHNCRQVCQNWNNLIFQHIWGSGHKKMILRERLQRNWGPGRFPSEEEISLAKMLETKGILDPEQIQSLTKRVKDALGNGANKTEVLCGAALAEHNLLGSVWFMSFRDIDLSDVPVKRLASLSSLASCVTGGLTIRNVTGGQQITTLFTNLKCLWLMISRQSLGLGETLSLVEAMAMQSGVKVVKLYGEVSLDMDALSEYNGQGVCRCVQLYGDAAARYKEELRKWAGDRNWIVEQDTDRMFSIYRN